MEITRAILPSREDQNIGHQDYSVIFAGAQDTLGMHVQPTVTYARTVKVGDTGLQHALDANTAEEEGILEGNVQLDGTIVHFVDYKDTG